MVVSHHAVARNWTQDLWKSSLLLTAEHLSSPVGFFVCLFVCFFLFCCCWDKVSFCNPGYPGMQRSACLCLLNAEIKDGRVPTHPAKRFYLCAYVCAFPCEYEHVWGGQRTILHVIPCLPAVWDGLVLVVYQCYGTGIRDAFFIIEPGSTWIGTEFVWQRLDP